MTTVTLYELNPATHELEQVGAPLSFALPFSAETAPLANKDVYRWRPLGVDLTPNPATPNVDGYCYTEMTWAKPQGLIVPYFDTNPYALPSSGPLSLQDIYNVLTPAGYTGGRDLKGMTDFAFGGGPYNIARFYGYVPSKVIYNNANIVNFQMAVLFAPANGVNCQLINQVAWISGQSAGGGSGWSGYAFYIHDTATWQPASIRVDNYGLITGQGGVGGNGGAGGVSPADWGPSVGGNGGPGYHALYVGQPTTFYNYGDSGYGWIHGGGGGGGGGGGSGYNDNSNVYFSAGGGGGGGGASGYPSTSAGGAGGGNYNNPSPERHANGGTGGAGAYSNSGGGAAGGNMSPYAVGATGGDGGGWGLAGNNGATGLLAGYGGLPTTNPPGGTGGPAGYWVIGGANLSVVVNTGSILGSYGA
jgi:hypothetical protein